MLAHCHRKLLYLPTLKTICGNSVVSALLMAQLEYWFANYPNGFYKFLKPCQHLRYRAGDSWTEELNLTNREFRTGFDKIGVRYKSKKHLHTMTQSGHDPFDGQYYLSYIDVRSGLTIYSRNHERVEADLAKLLTDDQSAQTAFTKQPIVFSRDADCAFPEMTNPHFQKCASVISGSADSSSPIKDTKNNNKEDTEKTATVSKQDEQISSMHSSRNLKVVAVVKNKKNGNVIDNRIGKTLTASQRNCVQRLLPSLAKYLPEVDLGTLETAIEYTLCDVESFSRAGYDFFKKLNTIQKAICAGKWQIPAVLQDKKIQMTQRTRADLQRRWREYQGEYQQLKALAEAMGQQGKRLVQEKIQKQMQACQKHMQLLEGAVEALNV